MDFSYLHLLNGALSTTLVVFYNGEMAVNGKLDKVMDEVLFGFWAKHESLIFLEELSKSQFSETNFEIGNSRVRSPWNVPWMKEFDANVSIFWSCRIFRF